MVEKGHCFCLPHKVPAKDHGYEASCQKRLNLRTSRRLGFDCQLAGKGYGLTSKHAAFRRIIEAGCQGPRTTGKRDRETEKTNTKETKKERKKERTSMLTAPNCLSSSSGQVNFLRCSVQAHGLGPNG